MAENVETELPRNLAARIATSNSTNAAASLGSADPAGARTTA